MNFRIDQSVAWVLAAGMASVVFGVGYGVRGKFSSSHSETASVSGHEQSDEMHAKSHAPAHAEAPAHGESVAHHQEPVDHEEPAHHEAHHAEWAYEGDVGPKAWGDLKPEFSTCKSGQLQSPIDIGGGKSVHNSSEKITWNYQTNTAVLANNGHTIEFKYGFGNYLQFGADRFELVGVHFHNPSEHKIRGNSYPLEMHLVHKNKEGKLAVVGVLFEEKSMNRKLAKLWEHLPEKAGDEAKVTGFDLAELMPKDTKFYHYRGSLTTPPCTEGVAWFVLESVLPIGGTQLDNFNRIVKFNARPVQPVANRAVDAGGYVPAH